MGLSSGGEAAVLNGLLTGAYISLHTADPGNTGASEVAGGTYARMAYGAYTITGDNPSVASNDNPIEYSQATTAWGLITHFGVWSASVAGTFKGGEALDLAKNIAIDDVFRFLAGQLTIESE